MNCAVNVLLKPRRHIFVSHELCKLFKRVKCSEIIFSKLSRILFNSGCCFAGCCFSRQSDKETLLSKPKESRVITNVNVANDQTECFHASETDVYQNDDSANMKRNFECVDKTVSQNTDVENNVLEFQCKKARTDIPEPVKEKENAGVSSPSVVKAEPVVGKEDVRPKKQRPNYFVAVQISNDQIHQSLKEVQTHMLERDFRLKRCMTGLKTLHITLMVMYIGDAETHARAMKALQNIHQEHDDAMSKSPLQLEFKGLSHFQNRVLFAKISTSEAYPRLCSLAESVKKHFAAVSIDTTDTKEHFTPHLTIAKLDFRDKRQGITRIDPSLYGMFSNQYFGSQTIESIQLLSMTNPKNDAGYYCGEEIYFSAFNPSNRINNLCSLLSVEEKKKDVKEIINKLMKQNLQ